MPINYKGVAIDAGYRLGIIIADQLILELKAVDKLSPIYTAQMLTHLKLAGIKTGFLINFNEKKLTDGLRRISL